MAKVLDIALENVEESLKSGSDFLAHSVFRPRPYRVRVNVLFHAVLCITASYAIWQFFSSTEEIHFNSVELAIHTMTILAGWLIGAGLVWGLLKSSDTPSSFKDVLHIYTFVHANAIAICSLITLVFFLFAKELASNAIIIQESSVVQQGGRMLDMTTVEVVRTTTQRALYFYQIFFLICGFAFLLIYQPIHLKMQTGASLARLYAITLIVTMTSVVVQGYLWGTSNQSTEVFGRVLAPPFLIPR